MESINEFVSKFTLCVLLTQMGKTFTAISKIDAELKLDHALGKSIHFIFTMNTLLNNKQFAKRLDYIEKTYGNGRETSICIFASKYDGKYAHIRNNRELIGLCAIESTCPVVVVMCSNSRRYSDGVEFLSVINNNNIGIYRAFAYYDELHQYICDSLRLQIQKIHDLDIVKGITALTASPDNIFEDAGFWSKLRLIQLDSFSDKDYVGCRDVVFNCIDDFFNNPYIRPQPFNFDEFDRQTLGFIRHVLNKHPSILSENTRTFIPAHKRRIGHETLRNELFEINPQVVVIVINGFEKTLQYKEDLSKHIKSRDLSPRNEASQNKEICEIISNLVHDLKLERRPIVITGFICVGMGQTLTHCNLGSFTSAIFGHVDLTNDDIYQLFGRITGRMKKWGDKYVQTQVYCPTTIMQRCVVMEECARNMACEYNGEIVSQEDYREPMHEMGSIGQSAIENIRPPKEKKQIKCIAEDSDKEWRVFDHQEEAIEFGKTIGVAFKRRKTTDAPKDLQVNGRNPTSAELVKRMWGINEGTIARMNPTSDEKSWCVYWRPSLIKKCNDKV
jgi:hypothetical protein